MFKVGCVFPDAQKDEGILDPWKEGNNIVLSMTGHIPATIKRVLNPRGCLIDSPCPMSMRLSYQTPYSSGCRVNPVQGLTENHHPWRLVPEMPMLNSTKVPRTGSTADNFKMQSFSEKN